MIGFLFNAIILAQGNSSIQYYDNCGVFDADPSNDCKQDCFGVWGGNAVLDECGNCGGNGPKENENCQGECIVEIDCFGICGGKAKLDDCGKCDTDETNDCLKSYFDKCGVFDNDTSNDCVPDCAGIWGGTVKIDGCGICGGDNSTCADCAGVPYGKAVYDKCNICDNNPDNDCKKDCEGIWGGGLKIDDCGICGGDNSTCVDCAGVPYGNAMYDNCNICDDNLDNDCVQDCAGNWGGDLVIDECGICGGNGISEEYCDCSFNVVDCMGVCGGDADENECLDEQVEELELNQEPIVQLKTSIYNLENYFHRTVSYYRMFNNMVDPFYREIQSLSLISAFKNNSYFSLDPTKVLIKLQRYTDVGYNDDVFITSYKYGENDVMIPSVMSVDYYTDQKISYNKFNQQKQSAVTNLKQINSDQNKSNKLTLLSRNIGDTNIAINLNGQIEIKGELEFVNSESRSLNSQDQTWNLDIEQKQQFDLEGTVGDRLTVKANQNSESTFDFENSLLLEYKGYDNEVIKSMQAGNIGVSLSEGTLFSVGMGKRAGVFGVKMSSQLGPLEMNTIIGREKIQKESFQLNDQNQGQELYDYQYIKDKYFFVDEIFKSNYYPLSSSYINLSTADYVIKDFKLYKLSGNQEVEAGMYEGNAYINPINQSEGALYNKEGVFWIELEDQIIGNDYYIDKYFGYVRLGNIQSGDVIAAHYTIGELRQDTAGNYTADIIDSVNPILTGTKLQDRCLLDTIEECEASTNSCTQEEYSNGLNCDYIELDGDDVYSNNPLVLKIIKTAGTQTPPSVNNEDGNPTWKLMMKNIYNTGLSSFYPNDEVPEIEIIYSGGQLGTETASNNGNSFLKIFGVDNKDTQGELSISGDGKVDSYFINQWGDLILPFDMPFSYDPITESSKILGNSHPDLIDVFDADLEGFVEQTVQLQRENGDILEYPIYKYSSGPAMYYSSDETLKSSEKQFKINIKNINQNTTINLGFMIVEGSETLTDGSTVLIKGIDYSIDYFSGTLTLISDRAKNNASSLNIAYDRNEIVSFDQKIIVGNSFKYNFDNTNNKLFGGLYFYKQSITDNKVEIGYEPMENFIWHLGGKYTNDLMNFNNSIDRSSFLNLSQDSKVSFSTEYAQIYPNPNPIGIAYIDDFESSKQSSSLPVTHSAWQLSSPPSVVNDYSCLDAETTQDCNAIIDSDGNFLCELNEDESEFISCDVTYTDYSSKTREKINWFNPSNDIPTEFIWPERKIDEHSKEKTLWLQIPNNKIGGNSIEREIISHKSSECDGSVNEPNYCYETNWWNGITTSLYASDKNQVNRKYLDIWINTQGLNSGYDSFYEGNDGSILHRKTNTVLHIDLGIVSEDINENGLYDSEDLNEVALQNKANGFLDFGEDVGIDSCTDEYEDGWGSCLCDNFDHGADNENPYNTCISEDKTFIELKQECNSIDCSLIANNECLINDCCFLESIDEFTSNCISSQIVNLDSDIDQEDPNGDSFDYNTSTNNFNNYNGTEQNSTINDYTYPDSEDLNGDQRLDTIDAYYSYEINFGLDDTDNQDIIESELDTNWKLYRIPLNEFKTVDRDISPDWTNIQNVRLWIEGEYNQFSSPPDDTIQLNGIGIASIEIVGNEWKELGIINNDNIGQAGYLEEDYTTDENISIQLINNQESDYYVSPQGVVGNNTNYGIGGLGDLIIDKEQSLVINFDSEDQSKGGIEGGDTAFIKKIVNYNDLDNEKSNSFFIYKNMEMYFNGNESDIGSSWHDQDGVDLVFRFGKDDNYYEIVKQIHNQDHISINDPNGWQNLKIDLDELTRYKLNRTELEDYNDYGIDACEDSYETGYINEYNSSINIPSCLPQEAQDLFITFNLICDNASILDTEVSLLNDEQESYCLINSANGDCSDLINNQICNNENEYYQNGSTWLYQQNINDPSGDNYFEVDVECCLNSCIPDPNDYTLPDFYCPGYSILDEYIGTDGDEQHVCYNLDGDICSLEDNLNERFQDPLINDWDNDGLYTIPADYIEDDQLWSWNPLINENINISTICEDCKELRVKGEPAINKMKYIMVGVRNNNNIDNTIYGSIWLNELRMTGVKRKVGKAFTSSFSFNLGELFNIDLSYKQEEASFHRLEQRLGSGNHSINYSVNFGFSPHEIFKDDYFIMPVNIKYTKGIYSPLYKPGSDIILGSIDTTPLELQNLSDNISFSTSIKTMLSQFYDDNLFYKYLLDNTKISYSYHWDQLSNTTVLNQENISEQIKFDYRLSFDSNNTWSPFKNIFEGDRWKYQLDNFIIKFLNEMKFYYTPQDIAFNASLIDKDNRKVQREIYGGMITDDENLDLQRNFQTNIKLQESFSFRYTVDMKNNLNEYLENNKKLNISELFDLTFSPGLKKSFKEQFLFSYNPSYLSWLGPRFSYTPNYSWTRDAAVGDISTADVSSDNKFTASFTFSFQQFINHFYEDESKSKSSSTYTSRRRSTSTRSKSNKPENKAFIIDQPHFKTILKFLNDIGKRFSSININYSHNTKNIYNNISPDFEPDYNFKLGFSDIPSNQNFSTPSAGIISSSSNFYSQELKLNTSVQLTDNLTLSNMEYRVSLASTNQSDSGFNETYSQSYFPLGASGDQGIPLFGWSINLRGLEKYNFIGRWFKSFGATHSFNGEKNEISTESVVQKIDFKRNFTPLIRFDMTTKNIPMDIDFTYNNTLSIANDNGQIERTANDQISLTFRYKKQSGFRIPIFFLRDFQVENEMDLSVKIGYDNSNTKYHKNYTNDISKFETIVYSKSYNIQPKLTYNFSKFVEGDIWFNYIISDNHSSGKKEETDLGFQIRIYFESFN